MSGRVVGIDLGTTNSEVAARVEGRVDVLAEKGEVIMPSVVGVPPGGALLVGEPAVNQEILYPDRTVRSVKRLMGTDERVRLGEQEYRPQEISALILGELRQRAERILGEPVSGAVITVPAWFTDAQRHATREAGEIAGLEVLRILNEPTAASLAYAGDGGREGTWLVYDLGGGTFDVSIVRLEADVNEVLASHGDTRLGGEDFDALLLARVLDRAEKAVRKAAAEPRVRARIRRAVEVARCRLSFEPFARVREEAIAEKGGVPLNLDVAVTREEFEAWVRPLVERTLESVNSALSDSGLSPADLTGVLLAGGVTRTPLVRAVLADALGKEPRTELHPDLCVALGAGRMAARAAGEEDAGVLVDITPWSFGPSHVSFGPDGELIRDRYHPVLRKGTPLPAEATDIYCTLYDEQECWNVVVYQGESENARENIEIGRFLVEGLSPEPAGNQLLCRLALDLNGILEVTATERATSLSKSVRIEGAVGRLGEREKAAATARVAGLLGREGPEAAAAAAPAAEDLPKAAREIVERYLSVRESLHPDDRAEGDELVESLRGRRHGKKVDEAVAELTDLLFYAEGGKA